MTTTLKKRDSVVQSMPVEPNEPPEISDELREQLHAKAEQLEAAAHKIGLHAQTMTLGATVDPISGEPGKLVLMTNFAIGDLAFSDRVQDPEQDAISDELAKIEHDFTIDSFLDLRKRFTKDPDGHEDDSES